MSMKHYVALIIVGLTTMGCGHRIAREARTPPVATAQPAGLPSREVSHRHAVRAPKLSSPRAVTTPISVRSRWGFSISATLPGLWRVVAYTPTVSLQDNPAIGINLPARQVYPWYSYQAGRSSAFLFGGPLDLLYMAQHHQDGWRILWSTTIPVWGGATEVLLQAPYNPVPSEALITYKHVGSQIYFVEADYSGPTHLVSGHSTQDLQTDFPGGIFLTVNDRLLDGFTITNHP